MEICSNLYNLLRELTDYVGKYELVRFAVNRTSIMKESSKQLSESLFSIEKEIAVTMLEDKLRMLGIIGKPSLACGSPYHNMPVEFNLLGQQGSKEESVLCVIEEYPKCCGAAIIKNFVAQQRDMSDGDHIQFFIKFIKVVYEILHIMGYSTVNYILSSKDNEVLYKGIELVIKDCATMSHKFINRKTQAFCVIIIKDV